VITTRRAGAADLIRPGENGLLIEAGSSESLATAIEAAVADREGLVAMRPAALASAAAWQWSDYRCRIAEVVLGRSAIPSPACPASA